MEQHSEMLHVVTTRIKLHVSQLWGQQRNKRETIMALQIGDIAPDFEAQTTEGRIRFHDWIGDAWCVLFSHPKDFTPVCTTELGYMAKLKPEFEKRNIKLSGSASTPSTTTPNGLTISRRHRDRAELPHDRRHGSLISPKLYGMLPAQHEWHVRGAHPGRQSDNVQRVRDRAGQED